MYTHLTLNGVHVSVGQAFVTGEAAGNTGGLPQLQFSPHPCGVLPGLRGTDDCPSIPANFRNTAPNPVGPVGGGQYTALPFGEE